MAIKDIELITRRVTEMDNGTFVGRAEARNELGELIVWRDTLPQRGAADAIAAMDGWIRVYVAVKRNAYVSTYLIRAKQGVLE